VINVSGNCLASAIVAKWEGVFDSERPTPAVVDAVV